MTMELSAGRIDYINTVPVYAGVDTGRVVLPGRTILGQPAELNRLLGAGRLDISSISSVAFARFWPRLLILPGISISSTGPVRSVLFYSLKPLPALTGTVGVTAASATARALLKIIVEDFYGLKVSWRKVDVNAAAARGEKKPAFLRELDGLLVIGDSALSLDLEGRFPHVLDLGAFWTERTGLPFVFGLWAVRREFAESRPEAVAAHRSALLKSLGYGLREMDVSVRFAASRSGLPEERVRKYFEGIDYILGPQHLAGLEHFFKLLEKRGEIPPGVRFSFFKTPREKAPREESLRKQTGHDS